MDQQQLLFDVRQQWTALPRIHSRDPRPIGLAIDLCRAKAIDAEWAKHVRTPQI